MAGPIAQLRLREQLEDRRRHDVRGRVAHRVEPVVGARIEQLVGLGTDLVRVDRHVAKRSASPQTGLKASNGWRQSAQW